MQKTIFKIEPYLGYEKMELPRDTEHPEYVFSFPYEQLETGLPEMKQVC
jgi:hypothetical protein